MGSFIGLVLGLVTAALGMTATARADTATFYTVTYVEVGPALAAQGAALVKQYGEATRTAPGATRVERLQRPDRPNQLVVLAAWTDQPAFEAHQAAAATSQFQGTLQPLAASPIDQRLHQALSVDAPAPSPAGAIYAVTHVDVIPPRKDDAVVALTQLAEASRKDPGHVRFDVVQQTNRPNHFTVIEVWVSRAAFDAHAMAPHVRRFRVELGPMSGSLYDERLYRPLE